MLCAPSIPPPKSPPRVDGLPIGRINVLFEVKVKKINSLVIWDIGQDVVGLPGGLTFSCSLKRLITVNPHTGRNIWLCILRDLGKWGARRFLS